MPNVEVERLPGAGKGTKMTLLIVVVEEEIVRN